MAIISSNIGSDINVRNVASLIQGYPWVVVLLIGLVMMDLEATYIDCPGPFY